MSETQTQTTEVVESEVIDNTDLPKEAGEANLALYEGGRQPVNMGLLQDLGFVSPIATPEQLRAAFDYQQKMFSAILADTDYLYTVTWKNGSKNEQRIYSNHAEAMEIFEKFKNLGSRFNAKPKKSGIVKLARALGITANRRTVKGLPDDPVAQYSYVEYEAIHEGTGKSEIGVGWCDKGERGGKISTHDVIATADTRAYNRAVLRLAGFGDVSADEIVAGISSDNDEPLPVTVPEPAKQKELKPLPASETDEVQTAARAWAQAIVETSGSAGRDDNGFAPQAKQDTRSAREMRAKARRGDAKAGHSLGSLGLTWTGTASDGVGYPTFDTGKPPVTPEQFRELQAAAEQAKANGAGEASAATKSAEEPEAKPEEKKGWDLSGAGSDKDDDKPAQPVGDKDMSIPGPSPAAETITTKQAKNISSLLKQLFSSKDEMKAWLKTNAHADSSIHIRSNQYEPIIKALKKRVEEKE